MKVWTIGNSKAPCCVVPNVITQHDVLLPNFSTFHWLEMVENDNRENSFQINGLCCSSEKGNMKTLNQH